MEKIKLVFFMIICSFLIMAGCTKNNGENNDYKIGLVTDSNKIDDRSFNQAAWEGLQRFGKIEGLKQNSDYKYILSTSKSKYIENLEEFAKSKYNLVFGVGYELASAMNSVASEYNKTKFSIIDATVYQPNVASVIFKENEGAFLGGVVAALKTKTNKVGFIGGTNSDVINRFKYGFMAGVKTVNPNVQIISDYVNGFDQPEKGVKLAATMYGSGVDIIFQAAGFSGTGVFTEAKNERKNQKKEVWVIGVDRDQYQDGLPENVTLASVVKRVDQAVYDVSKNAKSTEFQGGKTLIYGLKEDGVTLVKAKNNVEESILNQVDSFKDKIRNDQIIVPATEDEYYTYIKSLK